MKRALPVLGLLLAAAAFLAFTPGAAFADDEALVEDGPPSTVTGWSGIDLIVCDDDNAFDNHVAQWQREVIYFVIGNPTGAPQAVLDAVRAGILAWNHVNGRYLLVETTGDWDVAIVPVPLLAPGVLGRAGVLCTSPLFGIRGATVFVAGAFRSLTDIRHTTAHEVGHALGLGHSNERGDLLFPVFPAPGQPVVLCPSNLDVEALDVETVEHRIPRPVFAVRAAC
jgi:hypothetical protein